VRILVDCYGSIGIIILCCFAKNETERFMTFPFWYRPYQKVLTPCFHTLGLSYHNASYLLLRMLVMTDADTRPLPSNILLLIIIVLLL